MSDLLVAATVLTHNGGRRSANEDAVVVGSCMFTSVSSSRPHTVTASALSQQPVVVAVADGLGGHEAGEVAAAYVVGRLARMSAPQSAVPGGDRPGPEGNVHGAGRGGRRSSRAAGYGHHGGGPVAFA